MFPVIHKSILSDGIRHSVHHLQPIRTVIEGHGRDGSDLIVRISYHSHVYSIADSNNLQGHRFQDEGGKWRRFCHFRYQSSLCLPEFCCTMIEQNYASWISQDGNRKNNLAISDNLADGERYVVLYGLMPSKNENIDVELVVKSAFNKQLFDMRTKKRFGVRQMIKKCYFEAKAIP